MSAARQSAPSRTFGLSEASGNEPDAASTVPAPSGVRQLLGKISLSSFKNARPSFSFSARRNTTEPSTERPPIPTMMKPSGEIYSTPLPRLSMIVLSIVRSIPLMKYYWCIYLLKTMLGEFLCANVSTPFLLFMVKGRESSHYFIFFLRSEFRFWRVLGWCRSGFLDRDSRWASITRLCGCFLMIPSTSRNFFPHPVPYILIMGAL
jgi:hypothetical protein